MSVVDILDIVIGFLSVIISVLLLSNVIYPIFSVFSCKRKRYVEPTKLHKYAVMICARNEELVIGYLIDSVKEQDYPESLVDVYVLADNCTDGTAFEAKSHGATVFVRNDSKKIGKGYALDYLYSKIRSEKGDIYDGYFVFDADNLLLPNYISEMNRCFNGADSVLTSIRNTKNFGDSWISSGYAIGWLFQTSLLNVGRSVVKIPCFVNGTGFLIGSNVLRKMGGWNFHTLTEDCEFTVFCALNGISIDICTSAEFFDEQPSSFKISWNQRLRWAKGKYQVFAKYGTPILKKVFSKDFIIGYDAFTNIAPTNLMILLSCVLTFIRMVVASDSFELLFVSALVGIGRAYLSLFCFGIITLVLNWNKIRSQALIKILSVFSYPIHVFMYIPIYAVALFKSVKWEPIHHTVGKTVVEICDKDR